MLTIGSFDGLHMGHQQLLNRVHKLAEQRDGESIVITFDPHPRSVIYPKDDSLRLLNTTAEKVKRFAQTGIQHLVIVPFTIAFSQQSADVFSRRRESSLG
ncbi:MAG: adenylyltransferase/cytidyltransferase family protein [Bacteroidota bacterium]